MRGRESFACVRIFENHGFHLLAVEHVRTTSTPGRRVVVDVRDVGDIARMQRQKFFAHFLDVAFPVVFPASSVLDQSPFDLLQSQRLPPSNTARHFYHTKCRAISPTALLLAPPALSKLLLHASTLPFSSLLTNKIIIIIIIIIII